MTDFLRAEAGIRQLHSRYTDAVWRHDYRSFAECFVEDGEWRISGRVFRGRDDIEQGITVILDKFIHVLISFRTPIVSLNPDGTASSRTYVDERCAWKNGNRNISIGRYYEHCEECADGLWRFRWRLFELHYRGDADLNGTFFEHPEYGPPPAMPPRDANTEDMASKRWGLPPDTGA